MGRPIKAEFVYGKLGEKWSELPGNEHLPDRLKALVDTADFQESNLRGLADQAAGRSYSFEEFRRRHPYPRRPG